MKLRSENCTLLPAKAHFRMFGSEHANIANAHNIVSCATIQTVCPFFKKEPCHFTALHSSENKNE